MRSAEPSPSRCSWPTNSSSVCGRMRAASGPSGGGLLSGRFSGGSNSRSMTSIFAQATPDDVPLSAPSSASGDGWARSASAGPPVQVAMLRDLTVERRRWLDAREFEDANAAVQLIPGPAGTQLAIYCAMRVGGHGGRDPRRPRLHPARAAADPGDLRARARGLAARVDPRDRRGRRRRGGGGGGAGRHRAHALQPRAPARRAAAAGDRLRRRRRGRHGLRGRRARARAARLRVRRARVAAPARRRACTPGRSR